jgi:putative ABC transport system ATP-binding protein
MDHQPNQLSGGQRQRVAIARALVNKPSSLPMSTGNLDSKTSLEIMKLLETSMPTETVILVTHEEEIALCPQSHSFARRTH